MKFAQNFAIVLVRHAAGHVDEVSSNPYFSKTPLEALVADEDGVVAHGLQFLGDCRHSSAPGRRRLPGRGNGLSSHGLLLIVDG